MRRAALFAILCLCPLPADDRLLQSPPNDERQRDKPYVLLIGVDGFRWDYAERFRATNILALHQRGSSAKGLIPSFPSTTFPNFYTLVTGLRPDKHGLVSMRFFDPSWNEEFYYRNNSGEGKWFEGGTPLWSLAEHAGMRTAAYFWVGSEAAIHGERPSAWYPYDVNTSHEDRVKKVLEWLKLPEERRPHLITLYFSDVDSAGHAFSPDGQETHDAVMKVDHTLGQLFKGLSAVHPAVTTVMVSDHGMTTLRDVADLTSLADFSGVRVVNEITMILVYSKDEARLQQVESSLKKNNKGAYAVFRRADMPEHLHYRDNPREGELILLATGTHGIFVRKSPDDDKRLANMKLPRGEHGYDPRVVPDMEGIFWAAGPKVKTGVKLEHVDNISVFGFLANLLGVPIPEGADAGKDLVDQLYCAACAR